MKIFSAKKSSTKKGFVGVLIFGVIINFSFFGNFLFSQTSIASAQEIATGKVEIIKNARGVTPGEKFNFTTDFGNYEVSVGEILAVNLLPGSYSIREEASSGWQLSNITCRGERDNGTVVDLENGTAELDLDAGEIIKCIFTNEKAASDPKLGFIFVKKYLDMDGIASTTNDRYLASTTDWSFRLFDNLATSTKVTVNGVATFDGLADGTYYVSEYVPVGFELLSPTVNLVQVILGVNDEFVLNFVNKETVATTSPEGGNIKVRKFKDIDGLASTTADRVLSDLSWTINLSDGISTTTQITANGETIFDNLATGTTYMIEEVQKSGWQFVAPIDGKASTTLGDIEQVVIDFVNFQEPTDNGGGGSGGGGSGGGGSGGGGSGGGGGGGSLIFAISDERAENRLCDAITINWRTNLSSDSRVVWDTVSKQNDMSGLPNFGYANSSPTNDSDVTFHSVTVNGLVMGTTYFFKTISNNGGSILSGDEIAVATLPQVQCVLGEAGEPILTIDKTAPQQFVSPGEDALKFTVKVHNSGNLSAFNVVIEDVLPKGMALSNQAGNTAIRQIGNLAPGASTTLSFFVDISETIGAGLLQNTASVRADNHEKINDMAQVEVREAEVLAATGFAYKELLYLLSFSAMSFSLAWVFRKRLLFEV